MQFNVVNREDVAEDLKKPVPPNVERMKAIETLKTHLISFEVGKVVQVIPGNNEKTNMISKRMKDAAKLLNMPIRVTKPNKKNVLYVERLEDPTEVVEPVVEAVAEMVVTTEEQPEAVVEVPPKPKDTKKGSKKN